MDYIINNLINNVKRYLNTKIKNRE